MKLPDGVTVHVGGRKYKGEIPDALSSKLNKSKLKKQLDAQGKTGQSKSEKTKAD